MSQPSGGKIALVITRREIIGFVRQPARIAAAIGTPVLLWIFISSGVGDTFRAPGNESVDYAAFFIPGVITLIAVFTSIFSAISIIEDRNSGWLQGVLVSPAPRWSIALGKSLGGASVAFAQGAVILPAILLLEVDPGAMNILLMLIALAVTSLAMAALGTAVAWRSATTAGFHAVMNLLFMPMWLLSGALFPVAGAALWMRILMFANPLTWCTLALREPMFGEPRWLPFLIAAVFALTMLLAASRVIRSNRTSLV